MVDNKLVVCSSIAEKGEDEALLISEISKLKSRRTKLNDEYTKYSITLQDLNSQLHKQENYLADFDNSEEHNIEDLQDILVQLKKDQVVQNVVRRDILNIKNRIATKPYTDTIVHLSREVEKLGKRVENKPEMTCDYNEDDLRTNIAITTKKIAAIELVNGRYIELRKKIDAIQYNIDNSIFSSSVNMLEDDLRVIKIKLGKLKTINSTHSEEDVRDEIAIMKGLLAQKELLALDIAKYKGEIESIAKQLGDIDITLYKNVERDIADAEILIDKCKVDYVAEEALVARLDEWARYAVELKKWKTMKERHDKEKQDEGILRKKNDALLILKNKVLETQSISISNLIDNINSHAQIFLDKFFTDNPISVKIVSFKESKTGDKPCINLEIDYRGIEHDLTMLRGRDESRYIGIHTRSCRNPQLSVDYARRKHCVA